MIRIAIKKCIQIAVAVTLVLMFTSSIISNTNTNMNELKQLRGEIKRLTFSGNNIVQYPCLSDNGNWMLYTIEIKDGDETTKAVRIMNLEDGKETELFRDGERKALEPFEDAFLSTYRFETTCSEREWKGSCIFFECGQAF